MKRHLIKFVQIFGIAVLAMVVLFVIGLIGHILGLLFNPIVGALFYCAIFAGGWVILDAIFEK